MRACQLSIALVIAVVGCGGAQRPNPVREALQAHPPTPGLGTAVAFRFSASRTNGTKLYQLPDLDAVGWRFEGSATGPARVLGFASDNDLVYWIDGSHQLDALDLTSARVRVVDTAVALAALSPTGNPIVVHRDGSIATFELRTPHPWAQTLDSVPIAVWAIARNRLLALFGANKARTLALLADGQNAVRQPIPPGTLAVAPWGDAAVVAADSGLVVLEPARSRARRFIEMDPPPVAVGFSASAHQIYATDTAGALIRFDRYSLDRVGELELPAAARALRVDPLGRMLLVRPAERNVVWIVDVVRWQLAAVVPGEWGETLPAVAPDGSVLVRRERSVAALIGPDYRKEAGKATDARSDAWLTASWDPRRPVLALASDSTTTNAAPTSQLIYIQVSSTSNRDWAEDFAGNLRSAGVSASVLSPPTPGDPYRVVLGPYATRDEAEASGKRLGLPFWIYMRDTLTTTQ